MRATSSPVSSCMAVTVLLAPASLAARTVGTAFTYQGLLRDGGGPVGGTVDFQFGLWDAAGSGSPLVGGAQIGVAQAVNDVQIINGLFTVTLNAGGEFGTSAFNGDARYLQIGVRPGPSSGHYTVLSPRQAMTPTPYALRALNSPGLILPFSATFSDANYEGVPALRVIDQVNESAALQAESSGADGHSVLAPAPTGATVALHGDAYSLAPVSISKTITLTTHESSSTLRNRGSGSGTGEPGQMRK